LLDLLKTVPDPRGRRGRQHHLSAILAVGLAAVIAGARSFVAIGEWVAHQPIEALRVLGVTTPAGPDESTIRRVFALLDADVLDQLVGAFMWTRTHTVEQRRVIALDGKTVRGARTKTRTAPHLVAAFDHGTGVVVGQLGAQMFHIVIGFIWAWGVTWLIFSIAKNFMKIRVSPEVELEGLDMSEFGVLAYPDFVLHHSPAGHVATDAEPIGNGAPQTVDLERS